MEITEVTKEKAVIIARDLGISESDVQSYFRNYYINRTLPIRNLTLAEISLVKQYKEISLHSENDMRGMCLMLNIEYESFLADRWIVPKEYIRMSDKEYYIAKRYFKILLEPYYLYENHMAPRLNPLSKEEVTILLSNIAVGISIIPNDNITSYTSMMAMDRLVNMYDTMPKEVDHEANQKIKELSPAQLEAIINSVAKTEKPIELITDKGDK